MRNMRKAAFFVILLVFAMPIAAYANSIVIFPDIYGWSEHYYLPILTVLMSLIVEYLVVQWLINLQAQKRHVLSAFLIINFITYPITQYAAFFIFYSNIEIIFSFIFILWVAELIPLLLEPLLYKAYFNIFGIQVPYLKVKIIAANLVSFAFGLVAYYYIFPYIRVTFYS